MASGYHALFVSAFANGLFLAIGSKTGINISPTGIGLVIFDTFKPYVTEQNVVIFRFGEIVLLAIPWICLILIWIKFGIKGLIFYGIITLGSFLFIFYYWK